MFMWHRGQKYGIFMFSVPVEAVRAAAPDVPDRGVWLPAALQSA